MRLVLSEPRFLKESVSILSELVNDVKIKLDADKLEIVAMDPANVAMIVFRLLNSAFAEYDIKGVEVISVNLESLKQVLGRAKPNDNIVLELDEEKNRLKIGLRGESKRNFNLGLIDIHEKEQKVPELDFSGSVEMSNVVFNEAVEDMDIVADTVSLSTDGNSFLIEAAGNTHDAKVSFNKSESISVALNEDKENVKAKYSIVYLKKILKGGKLADKVSLKFGQDYPLQIEYKVTDKLHFRTLLAPRVSND
jgi:proliferating cell nuclear antigen